MKKTIVMAVFLQLALVAVPVPGEAAEIERTEVIEKTLRFGSTVGTDRLVVVDNVFGAIDVTGYDGEEIRVTVRKTIVARSEAKAEKAEEVFVLDITEEDDLVELYVDGPFRDSRRRGINWHGYKRAGYKVIYDFELQVPRDCAVELKTVNEGDIYVSGVAGDFELCNVNGEIEMKKARGSGSVNTVNGRVSVEFDRNPPGDCSFGTINGDVRLYFRPDLSADFYMETMNGEAFTDFEVSALPTRTISNDKKNGKKVYKIGHMSGVRAGRGGPEFELSTLNGDMFILSQ
jgi:hypothetical protein